MGTVVKTRSAKQSGLSSGPVSPRTRTGRGEASRLWAVQRRRIILAMVEVVCERGLEETTVADVVRRARVSRRTFYDVFEDRTDAFLAAFEEGVRQAEARIIPAFEDERAWTDRVRAGLAALLSFFDEEPELARLCVVHSLSAGPAVLARRTLLVRQITGTFDAYARGALRGPGPPPMTAEGVVGGVIAIVHTRLLEEERSVPLVDLVGPLMGLIVLPYASRAVARRELSRPALERGESSGVRARRRRARGPLENLEMRLTYRTLRVLAAIAAHPGASNRDVADDAGVKDQGQISKLLARLERLGLVQNTVTGQPKGEPNAWMLTSEGREVELATRAG